MSKPGNGPSLIERAAQVYDFGAEAARLRSVAPSLAAEPAPAAEPLPVAEPPLELTEQVAEVAPARPPVSAGPVAAIDRVRLAEQQFIIPDAEVTGLAEEFRIVKRRLLAAMQGDTADARRQSILVCSAGSGEGKTFTAINLALSMAGERDRDVLLVDADLAKPQVPALLGIEPGAGLIDAIADPATDVEALVVRTDVPGLSLLPAGRRANNATELLASDRARNVLARLIAGSARRIVIFDSPPALLASPASVLAAHVGQVLLVVRADHTSESDLREAAALLSDCESISLMLNAASLSMNGRRFGSYYEDAR